MRIGFICWRQGGGTSDYVSATPKKSWMKDLKKETKGEYKGKYPFEKALIAAMQEKYKNDVKPQLRSRPSREVLPGDV